jgi:hypothetical protein
MQKTSKFKHIKKLMSKYQFYQARSLNKKWHEQENIYTSHLSKEHDRQGHAVDDGHHRHHRRGEVGLVF